MVLQTAFRLFVQRQRFSEHRCWCRGEVAKCLAPESCYQSLPKVESRCDCIANRLETTSMHVSFPIASFCCCCWSEELANESNATAFRSGAQHCSSGPKSCSRVSCATAICQNMHGGNCHPKVGASCNLRQIVCSDEDKRYPIADRIQEKL